MTRVGLAGYAAARTLHMPSIVEAGGEIIAVATNNPERAAAVGGELPGADVVPDLDALLARDDLDLVVLVTPTARHHEHALATVEAGIPFVIDKPLGITADQAIEIRDAAKRAGVPMSVFHNRRYDAPHLALRDAVRSGRLGEVHSFEAGWCRWRPTPPRRWRELLTSEQGGGVLLDLAPHIIDAALDIVGPANLVWAEVASRRSPADDDVRLVLEHANGALTTLHASNTSPLTGRRFRVVGGEAAFVFGTPTDEVTPAYAGEVVQGEHREPAPLSPSSFSEPFAPFYEQVFAALRSDEPQKAMPVLPEEAIAVAEIIDQARVFSTSLRNDQ